MTDSEAPFDIRRIARVMSAVENGTAAACQILRDAYRAARYVPVIGVTGLPGAGKSTLVDRLAVHWAERQQKVAVLAIDPSSAFSGGALLGDRVRMDRAAAHPNVFVRSLSSRGVVGGLARAAHDMAIALGAFGFGRVVIETVGAGQTDIAVATLADAVVVVTVPHSGDQVQASKAGILEIGDVYAVNKADLAGAEKAVAHLTGMLDLIYPGAAGRNTASLSQSAAPGYDARRRRHGSRVDGPGFWRPPVLAACARTGGGVEALAAAIDDFLAWCHETGPRAERMQERVQAQIVDATRERLLGRCLAAANGSGVRLGDLANAVTAGVIGIEQAADRLIAQLIE
jgi:LAO/AO transport system kinase